MSQGPGLLPATAPRSSARTSRASRSPTRPPPARRSGAEHQPAGAPRSRSASDGAGSPPSARGKPPGPDRTERASAHRAPGAKKRAGREAGASASRTTLGIKLPDAARPRPERSPRCRPRLPAARAGPQRRAARRTRTAAPRLPARAMRAGAGIASNPVLVGAVTVLVVDRRRLPGLQRQQRPAVRADHDAEGARPQRRQPRARATRSARAAPASASSTTCARCGSRTARSAPSSTLKLDKRIGDVPRDSTFRIRPRSALGLKYVELDEGTSEDDLRRRRHGAGRAGRRSSTELDEVLRCSTSRRARRRRRTCAASATRSPAAAQSVGRTLEELPPLLAHLSR